MFEVQHLFIFVGFVSMDVSSIEISNGLVDSTLELSPSLVRKRTEVKITADGRVEMFNSFVNPTPKLPSGVAGEGKKIARKEVKTPVTSMSRACQKIFGPFACKRKLSRQIKDSTNSERLMHPSLIEESKDASEAKSLANLDETASAMRTKIVAWSLVHMLIVLFLVLAAGICIAATKTSSLSCLGFGWQDQAGATLKSAFWQSQKNRPMRLILIRHGQSEANINRKLTETVPDHVLHLTGKGREQALDAGKRLKEIIGDESVKFIVSPYVRAIETFNGIKQAWPGRELNYRTDVRIREQEFGNFEQGVDMKALHKTKKQYGEFYFRFPDGESPADCYDRASTFLESMYRSWEDNAHTNQVIVGHGVMILLIILRLFRYSIEEWETWESLDNCEFVVLERPPDDCKFSVAYTWMGDHPKCYEGLRSKSARPTSPTSPKGLSSASATSAVVWDGSLDAVPMQSESTLC